MTAQEYHFSALFPFCFHRLAEVRRAVSRSLPSATRPLLNTITGGFSPARGPTKHKEVYATGSILIPLQQLLDINRTQSRVKQLILKPGELFLSLTPGNPPVWDQFALAQTIKAFKMPLYKTPIAIGQGREYALKDRGNATGTITQDLQLHLNSVGKCQCGFGHNVAAELWSHFIS